MWRSGAPQRRVARAAPQGRRCTYVLLCAVVPDFTSYSYQLKQHVTLQIFHLWLHGDEPVDDIRADFVKQEAGRTLVVLGHQLR
jgi:hypothetical protein